MVQAITAEALGDGVLGGVCGFPDGDAVGAADAEALGTMLGKVLAPGVTLPVPLTVQPAAISAAPSAAQAVRMDWVIFGSLLGGSRSAALAYDAVVPLEGPW